MPAGQAAAVPLRGLVLSRCCCCCEVAERGAAPSMALLGGVAGTATTAGTAGTAGAASTAGCLEAGGGGSRRLGGSCISSCTISEAVGRRAGSGCTHATCETGVAGISLRNITGLALQAAWHAVQSAGRHAHVLQPIQTLPAHLQRRHLSGAVLGHLERRELATSGAQAWAGQGAGRGRE